MSLLGPWPHFSRMRRVAVVAAWLLLPRALPAQGPATLPHSVQPADPFEVLFQRKRELGLTPVQVARLTVIQRRLHAANDSLVAQLLVIRHEVRGNGTIRHADMPPEHRAAFEAAVERARPLMRSIGRNNQGAMHEVGSVLTPSQKAIVRGWLEHRPRTQSAPAVDRALDSSPAGARDDAAPPPPAHAP